MSENYRSRKEYTPNLTVIVRTLYKYVLYLFASQHTLAFIDYLSTHFCHPLSWWHWLIAINQMILHSYITKSYQLFTLPVVTLIIFTVLQWRCKNCIFAINLSISVSVVVSVSTGSTGCHQSPKRTGCRH